MCIGSAKAEVTEIDLIHYDTIILINLYEDGS